MTSSTNEPEPDYTRRWLIRTTLAIGVSLGLFTVLAFVLLRPESSDAEVIGAARLTWDPASDDPLGEGKAASVEVIEEDGDYRVYIFDVEVLRPPAEFEFVEAWFVDSDVDEPNRLSIGSFDALRTRLFPMPDEIDPRVYDAIEFSLEPDDGDDGYSGRTLVRGDIAWLVEPPK